MQKNVIYKNPHRFHVFALSSFSYFQYFPIDFQKLQRLSRSIFCDNYSSFSLRTLNLKKKNNKLQNSIESNNLQKMPTKSPFLTRLARNFGTTFFGSKFTSDFTTTKTSWLLILYYLMADVRVHGAM